MNTNENTKTNWAELIATLAMCGALLMQAVSINALRHETKESAQHIKQLAEMVDAKLFSQMQLIGNEASSIRAAVQNASRGNDFVTSDVLAFGYRSQHHQLGMTNNMALGSYASTFKDNQITVRFRSGKSMFIDVPEGEVIDSHATYQDILQSIKRAMEQRGETNTNTKTP